MTARSVAGVVVNYRTADLTCRAVISLLDDGADEVVVVENGSYDDSATRLQNQFSDDGRVRIVMNERNVGFGGGVNRAAMAATSELLMVLNSDATVRAGTIEALAARLADPAVGVVAPVVIEAKTGMPQPDVGGPFPSLWTTLLRRNRRLDETSGGWVSGVAFMIRRDVFQRAGGFDEGFFMYFEDVDLCWRLHHAGLRTERETAAFVEHVGRGSQRSWTRQQRQYFESQERWLRKTGTPAAARVLFRVARFPVRIWRTLQP